MSKENTKERERRVLKQSVKERVKQEVCFGALPLGKKSKFHEY